MLNVIADRQTFPGHQKHFAVVFLEKLFVQLLQTMFDFAELTFKFSPRLFFGQRTVAAPMKSLRVTGVSLKVRQIDLIRFFSPTLVELRILEIREKLRSSFRFVRRSICSFRIVIRVPEGVLGA